MTKNFRIREIKMNRAYTYNEAKCVICGSEGALRSWVKVGGLPLLTKSPQHLILGADLKAFIVEKRAKRRVNVPYGHIYCLKCKNAARPVAGTLFLKDTPSGAKLLHAECSCCGGKLRKSLSPKRLAEFGL
jgi:hypothetical protein